MLQAMAQGGFDTSGRFYFWLTCTKLLRQLTTEPDIMILEKENAASQ
jgi:hypothetical protein